MSKQKNRIQNKEEYKLLDIDSLNFSVRLKNVAHENNLKTLYELVDCYNSGEFERMKNVGPTTINELLSFESLSVIVQKEKTSQKAAMFFNDETFPTEFLEKDVDDFVFNGVLLNYLKNHSINKIKDLFELSSREMLSWQHFGRVKEELVLDFKRRLLNGDKCFIWGNNIKKTNEIEASREIDFQILTVLKKEYGLKFVWLSDWFDVSRQMIDQKIQTAKRNRIGKWCGYSYTEQEKNTVIEMLKDKQLNYREGCEFYYFLKNGNGKFAILIVNKDSIRCFFDEDIDTSFKEFILNNRFNELDFREFEIRANGTEVSLLRKIHFVPNREDLVDFVAYAKLHKMSRDEYSNFLTGKPYAFDFTITDDKICQFFDEHLNKEGKVYISSDPINQWIKSYASRNGYKISEFIEFYGYQSALSSDLLTTEGAKKRHLETIKNYIVHDNVVFIPTYCDFYKLLNSYSASKGKTITEYVSELGYERILM